MPVRAQVFAARAKRLRTLAEANPIGDYLRLLATVADTQQALLDCDAFVAAAATSAAARAEMADGAPPLSISTAPPLYPPQWRHALGSICKPLCEDPRWPASLRALARRLLEADSGWLDRQASNILGIRDDTDGLDVAATPVLHAALQACWTAMGTVFDAGQVPPPTAGTAEMCPLCASVPVASIVHVRSPYQGYRYLHCPLCACQWHRVRVHCSHCGAAGKDISYHSLQGRDTGDDQHPAANAVRAETCERCRGYRKIMYVEKDPQVDPIADDLATLALDLLLGERGYARLSRNPLLWQISGDPA